MSELETYELNEDIESLKKSLAEAGAQLSAGWDFLDLHERMWKRLRLDFPEIAKKIEDDLDEEDWELFEIMWKQDAGN